MNVYINFETMGLVLSTGKDNIISSHCKRPAPPSFCKLLRQLSEPLVISEVRNGPWVNTEALQVLEA